MDSPAMVGTDIKTISLSRPVQDYSPYICRYLLYAHDIFCMWQRINGLKAEEPVILIVSRHEDMICWKQTEYIECGRDRDIKSESPH